MLQFELHDISLVLISIFCTATLFNFALYFGYHKKLDYLFFAFYCAFHVFKVWLKTFPSDQVVISALNLTAFDMIYISVIFGLFSLNVFLLFHYHFKKKKTYTTALLIFSLGSYFILPEDIFIYISVLIAIIQSVRGQNPNTSKWIYFSGLLALLILSIFGVYGIVHFGYFIGTIIMIILMVISSGIELSKQMIKLNTATLQSAKLENQLLKKSIQPHFILNSLTSLQELIEHEPDKASEFVQNLASVFSMFSKVSDNKLIAIEDELKLVNSFIQIMAVRMDKDFELKTLGIDGTEKIPPGILLTLIENGITHGFGEQQTGLFTITKETSDQSTSFTIENNGESAVSIKEGLGFQYVRSKLKEAFGNRYVLQLNTPEHGFQTKIIISQ